MIGCLVLPNTNSIISQGKKNKVQYNIVVKFLLFLGGEPQNQLCRKVQVTNIPWFGIFEQMGKFLKKIMRKN